MILERAVLDRDGAEAILEERVRFLPALDFETKEELAPTEGARVLPCFPCDFLVFLPGSTPTTCIREQRYRAMYNDVLVSGGRRIVVPFVQKEEETGRAQLSEIGVVFHLEDLKEVSEETDDRLKYVCSHSVVGRVRLQRVLNPFAFKDASTYLRVEVEDVAEIDFGVDVATTEHLVMDTIRQVASLQVLLDSRTRLSKNDLDELDVGRGFGFWNTVGLWRNYIDRLEHNKLEQMTYETPVKDSDELRALRARLHKDAKPDMVARNKRMQELLQSESHVERLELFLLVVQEEEKRLRAQQALKSVFGE